MLRSVRSSVRPSVCLLRDLILSRSLDGDMRASPFQTHSICGSIKMLPPGGYRFAVCDTLLHSVLTR